MHIHYSFLTLPRHSEWTPHYREVPLSTGVGSPKKGKQSQLFSVIGTVSDGEEAELEHTHAKKIQGSVGSTEFSSSRSNISIRKPLDKHTCDLPIKPTCSHTHTHSRLVVVIQSKPNLSV